MEEKSTKLIFCVRTIWTPKYVKPSKPIDVQKFHIYNNSVFTHLAPIKYFKHVSNCRLALTARIRFAAVIKIFG